MTETPNPTTEGWELTQEEWSRVGKLLAMDIETISMAAGHTSGKLDPIGFLQLLKEKKDRMLEDPNLIKTRYEATASVFAVARGANNVSD